MALRITKLSEDNAVYEFMLKKEAEGAKFCLSVCNDLNNREVKVILIACMDGLRRLPEAIK